VRIVTVLLLTIGIIVVLTGVRPIYSPQLVTTTSIMSQFVTLTRTWLVWPTRTVTSFQERVTNNTITASTTFTSIQPVMVTRNYTVARNFTISGSVQGDYYHILAVVPLAAIGGLGFGFLLWARRRHIIPPSEAALSRTTKPTSPIDEDETRGLSHVRPSYS